MCIVMALFNWETGRHDQLNWWHIYFQTGPCCHEWSFFHSMDKSVLLDSFRMHHRGWAWWRSQLEIFSALLAFVVRCSASLARFEANSPVTGEFPSQRPLTRSFDVFFHLRLNQQLSKQWIHRWFETPSRWLWCHCNVTVFIRCMIQIQTLTEHKGDTTSVQRRYQIPQQIQANALAMLFPSANDLV